MQLFAEKVDLKKKKKKKRPKRDPKSGLGLLRDPGLPKRDPVGSSAAVSFRIAQTVVEVKTGCYLSVPIQVRW